MIGKRSKVSESECYQLQFGEGMSISDQKGTQSGMASTAQYATLSYAQLHIDIVLTACRRISVFVDIFLEFRDVHNLVLLCFSWRSNSELLTSCTEESLRTFNLTFSDFLKD